MTTNSDDQKLTIEEIMEQIKQEENLKEMMENSAQELKNTIENMDDKFTSLDDEGNEWKTRYETQIEINNRLNWQVGDLKRKLQEKNYRVSGAGKREIDEISGSKLRSLVKQLEREKVGTLSQLRNLEWRLDQESKALHKALDKRKKYQTGIAEASYNLNSYQRLQKSDEIRRYQLGQNRSIKRR